MLNNKIIIHYIELIKVSTVILLPSFNGIDQNNFDASKINTLSKTRTDRIIVLS